MAIQRLAIDGYGQVELNNVTFRRDGRIEAQCKLDSASFTKAKPAENGMLYTVDKTTRTIGLPTAATALPIALHYSSEHMYDEREDGLKNFCLVPGTFLPRMGYLTLGDTYTANTISYDAEKFTDDDKLKEACTVEKLKTTPLYATYHTDGTHVVSDTKPTTSPILKVVKGTTMPDGQFGIKFQCIG